MALSDPLDGGQSILVYMTLPQNADAAGFADSIIQQNLAAGVNIVQNALSIYRWRGEVKKAGEYLLFAQTSRAAFEKLREFVAKNHPYAVPCVIGLPIDCGYGPFLDWITENSGCRMPQCR